MDVPYRSDEDIERCAEEFLRKYCPECLNETPITITPIELIVEDGIGLEIVPFRGYRDRFGIDGSLSTDLTNITVDEYVLEHYPNRLRFTLAHEVGHWLLHAEVIKSLAAQSTEEWRERRLSVPLGMHRRMELQASQFASCVLVPQGSLQIVYEEAKTRLAQDAEGLEPDELTESAISWLAGWIAKKFDVSTKVMEIRLRKLGL